MYLRRNDPSSAGVLASVCVRVFVCLLVCVFVLLSVCVCVFVLLSVIKCVCVCMRESDQV